MSLLGSRAHCEAVDLMRPIGANSIRARGLDHLIERPDSWKQLLPLTTIFVFQYGADHT